jgi:hypothetical protein
MSTLHAHFNETEEDTTLQVETNGLCLDVLGRITFTGRVETNYRDTLVIRDYEGGNLMYKAELAVPKSADEARSMISQHPAFTLLLEDYTER